MFLFVVLNPTGRYTLRIASAVEALGEDVKVVSRIDFDYNWVERMNPYIDTVFFRTGSLEAVPIARAFERQGFRVLNDSRYIHLTGDKYLANAYAESVGLPVPDLTVKIDKSDLRLQEYYLDAYGPLVAKPVISWDKGRFVYLIEEPNELKRLQLIPGASVILQSYVKLDLLVRIVATSEGVIVPATTYVSPGNSWKASACGNPSAKHYRDVPDRLVKLAERFVSVYGAEVAFIDFFSVGNEFVLNEINHSCDLLTNEKITKCPIAARIADFLARRGSCSEARNFS
jgi:glutathione synthase/RimK-type ligase-like ATP-grasp enzyme